MKSYPKKCWARNLITFVVYTEHWLLYGKFPALLGEVSVVNSDIPPKRAGPPLIYTKTSFEKEFNWDGDPDKEA